MIFVIVTTLFVILDQITKFLAIQYLKPLGTYPLLDGLFSLTYVENRGAAFGILQNARWIFIFVTLLALGAMIFYKLKYKPKEKALNISLCLLISGAVGNMIDRIFRLYVVDMLEVTFIDYPVFNVADCFVVLGAIILAVYVIFIYKEPEKKD